MSPASTPHAHGGRTGRRKGPTTTRDEILEAALEVFSERGYEGATLRAITAKAGVDVALVGHFFGGKQGLFEEAVLRQAQRGAQLLLDAQSGTTTIPGMLDAYFRMWEEPDTARTVQALFRAALESDQRLAALQGSLNRILAQALVTLREGRPSKEPTPAALPDGLESFLQITENVNSQPGSSDPKGSPLPLGLEVTSQMLASQLLGVGISRYIMELSPIADVPREEIVARLTPVVESFLAGPPPEDGPAE